MKILAYLAFTMLSVMIQFCIIDYIQAKVEIDGLKPKLKPKDLNVTSQKKKFTDFIKEYSNQQHALYYRTDNAKLLETLTNVTESPTVYSNESTMGTDNPPTSTVYDILYEDNATSLNESPSTSDMPFTTTEFENFTDLTLFNNKNATNIQPTPSPKKKSSHHGCYCDLLYHLCDINCCCDGDCTDNQRKLFNCTEKGDNFHLPEEAFYCSNRANESPMLSGIENLFCVVKTNLPEKRNINYKKYNAVDVSKLTEFAMKWHDKSEVKVPIAITPKIYSHGDPILILRNDTVTYIDLPSSKINGNCDSRSPTYFLKNQHVQCNVVLRELEMFNILKIVEETKVISVKSMNISNLNCSELHCTDWEVKICNTTTCSNYTKDLHEPYCTDKMDVICKNIAVKVEYVFYYWQSKIVNAVLYFHVQTVSSKVQYIRQQISVKFYLAENSTKEVVELSGNPGYLVGFPLIASYYNNNFTTRFFDNGSKQRHSLHYPVNINGFCVFTNNANFVNFGTNKRNKCRYMIEPKAFTNATEGCQHIYNTIINILGFSRRTGISPLGNPHGLIDKDWVVLNMVKSQQFPVIGELRGSRELQCNFMVTKVSLYFGFADVSDISGKETNKLLTATAVLTTQNITVNDDNLSVILTFESNFVDVTKPPTYEYAASPQLNIHLPKDFFFPFPSNKINNGYECNVAILVISLVLTFISK